MCDFNGDDRQRLARIEAKLDDLFDVAKTHITRVEFKPVQLIVYGAVGIGGAFLIRLMFTHLIG